MSTRLCNETFVPKRPVTRRFHEIKLEKRIVDRVRDCKPGEEFALDVIGGPELSDANPEMFVSLVNVSLIVEHKGEQLPILFNDPTNFVFTANQKILPDHTKLFINPYFPPFANKVWEFFFVPEFNERTDITLIKMSFDLLNQTDYCFGFRYYNVDNKATLSVVGNGSSSFRYDIVELSDTYYEEPSTSYAWKQIDGICLRAYFRLRRGAFPDPFLVKILSSGVQSDANIFAFASMTNPQAYDYKEPGSYLVSWDSGGKDTNGMLQWLYTAQVGHVELKGELRDQLAYMITTKPQNRPISYHLNSHLVVYESPSILRFAVDNKLSECLLTTQFVDLHNRVLKSDLRKFGKKNGSQPIDISFSETDALGLNKTNRLFRVVFTVTVPRSKSATDDEKSQSEKTFVLSKLSFNDPCRENGCKNGGECIPKNGREFACECPDSFAGDRCEYPNRCTGPLNDTETRTGDEYCRSFGESVKCRPVNNDFECVCLGNDYWDQMECKKVSTCTFRVCGLQEACWLNDTSDVEECRCRYDHTFNKKTGRCEADPCWAAAICDNKKDCIPVLGKPCGECECTHGYARGASSCYKAETDNPFPKQSMSCEHTFKVVNVTGLCDCFSGYELAEDGRSCIKKKDFNDKECADKCNPNKQVCVQEEGKAKCKCKSGFSGQNCVNNVCELNEPKIKDIIEKFCGPRGCRVNTRNESNYWFECKCDSKFAVLNETTGKCELADPCTAERVERCAKGSAICVPLAKLVKQEQELSSECACPLGKEPDTNGSCVDSCKAKCAAKELQNYCDFDIIPGYTNCSCNVGYVQMPGSEQCMMSSDSVSLTVEMVLRSTQTLNGMDWYKVPDNTLLDVCKLLRDKRNCLMKYSEVYRTLYYNQINRPLIDRHIKSQIRSQLRESFKQIVHQRPFDVWVLAYRNLTPIDYQQFGYKTNYSVDLLVASRFNERDEVPLMQQVSLKRIKEKCFRLGDEDNVRHSDDLTECVVPPHLLLYNLASIQPVREDPCDLNLVECPAYSQCSRYSNGRQSFRTRCSCHAGFTQRNFETQLSGVEFPSLCQDQDECTDEEFQNYCDASTTTCENTPGSYKCNCLPNYRRVSAFTCDGECCWSCFSCRIGWLIFFFSLQWPAVRT